MLSDKTLPSKRLTSLDALRGFDMFWIVSGEGIFHGLANATHLPFFEGVSRQLHHTTWNGFTMYDLIFPLFIFIAGIAMPFSFGKKLDHLEGLARKKQKQKLYRPLIIRCVALILLGMVVNGALALPGYAETRFASVLGRISLSLFFAAIIYLNCSFRKQLIWLFVLLLGYWALMSWVPVPGFGAGVLTPEGNLSGYLDRQFLPGLVLRGDYDPEGYLSTIPAIGTALLGVFTGRFLRNGNPAFTPVKKAILLLGAGVICLLLGLLWNIWFPINKNIWTSSFVVFCAGCSLLLLGVFYLIIDVLKWQLWCRPFIWLGMNSILIYMASHGIINFKYTSEAIFGGLMHLAPERFHEALLWTGVAIIQFGFLYFLYKKRIFLKL
ncbi:acyltransferase family protein [Arachidicoccus terrestris]|uniref:acyltransferase family protein n=1 Tax=Arachidicoccus terrestris TaxID=2875539 RepID=UPI001CC5676A|nr:DUF5009 domain-containing protein [Arachidicoccus terrestris]UAY55550.1 DUF5009 domain-containing protein [Arachidicoccus terrestris]